MTIINDDSRFITKLETSLTDDTRVVIYDRHLLIVQATSVSVSQCSLKYIAIRGGGVM